MKTRTKKQTTANLDPGLIAAYRDYPAIDIADSIQALPTFLAHAALFASLGALEMAANVERTWWQDAVILAAEPAGSAEQGRRKIAALEPALDGRPWQIADEGLRAIRAMIIAASELERRRWGFAAATRH